MKIAISLKDFILSASLLICIQHITAQKTVYSADEIKRMKDTYTYFIVQETSLELLGQMYPDLHPLATDASKEWFDRFYSSITVIDKILTDTLAANWEEEKKQLYHKYSNTDYTQVSKDKARDFIQLVFKRALGKMDSPFLETLLIYRPDYLKQPELEFSDGFVKTYTTGNTKNKSSLNLRITYPSTWVTSDENSKSGYHQVFISRYGSGNFSMELSIDKLSKRYTQESAKALLTKETLQKGMGKNAEFTGYSGNKAIDNLPAASITYVTEGNNSGKNVSVVSNEYHTYYDTYHIRIKFTYSSDGGKNDAIMNFDNYVPLIKRIVTNIVILSQWDKKRF